MAQANITILDTGFIKPTNEGTQLSTANRCNAGTAFILSANELIATSRLNGRANPELGTLDDPEFNIGSIESASIKIRGILNMEEAEDQALFYNLWRCPRTFGYKAVFYNVDTAAGDILDKNKQLITKLANGHKDTTESQGNIDMDNIVLDGSGSALNKDLTDVEHIHVIFTDFTPKQTGGKRMVSYELNGNILKPGP